MSDVPHITGCQLEPHHLLSAHISCFQIAGSRRLGVILVSAVPARPRTTSAATKRIPRSLQSLAISRRKRLSQQLFIGHYPLKHLRQHFDKVALKERAVSERKHLTAASPCTSHRKRHAETAAR